MYQNRSEMIPTTPEIERWLRHIAGVEEIPRNPNASVITEAVELNTEAAKVISTFGDKEFWAVVGFVDMQGFSSASEGKTPREVRDIADPFVKAVIESASKHNAFIDKTIGDEVMAIFPVIGHDVLLSDLRFDASAYQTFQGKAYYFMADLLIALEGIKDSPKFTAGFAYGKLVLDQVGNHEFSEWTCYGNCVNAAKRIQSEASSYRECLSTQGSVHALGFIKCELQEHCDGLDMIPAFCSSIGRARLAMPVKKTKSLKGVGEVCFIVSGVFLDTETK